MTDTTNSSNPSGRVTYRHRDVDVVCTLGADDVGTRTEEWRRLREHAGAGVGVEKISGGVRLWLDSAAHDDVADLARRESECCGFLDFDLVPEGDRDRLDITSPVPEAISVIEALAGVGSQRDGGRACCAECC